MNKLEEMLNIHGEFMLHRLKYEMFSGIGNQSLITVKLYEELC